MEIGQLQPSTERLMDIFILKVGMSIHIIGAGSIIVFQFHILL